MFKDLPEGQINFDPVAEAEARLADKLEELYPKGESKCRSQALVFNAYAVMELRKLRDLLARKE